MNLCGVMASAQHWQKQAACDNRSWVDGETVKVTDAMTDTTACHIHPEHLNITRWAHAHNYKPSTHTATWTDWWNAHISIQLCSKDLQFTCSIFTSMQPLTQYVSAVAEATTHCQWQRRAVTELQVSLRLKAIKPEPLHLNVETCPYKLTFSNTRCGWCTDRTIDFYIYSNRVQVCSNFQWYTVNHIKIK